MYSRTNLARYYAGLTILDAAPTVPGVAPIPLVTFTADSTDGIVVTAIATALPAGWFMSIGMSIPVSQAKNYYKAPFRNIAVIADADVLPVTIVPDTDVTDGQRFFLSFRMYAADGKVSSIQIVPTPTIAP